LYSWTSEYLNHQVADHCFGGRSCQNHHYWNQNVFYFSTLGGPC
jgi:hypothetical protein